MIFWATLLSSVLATGLGQDGDETLIKIDAGRVLHRVSPLLYGACIEDVNHEIYGGLYSQMIFGESFQEPPKDRPLIGFTTYGGRWTTNDGTLDAGPGDGPKLIVDGPPFASGTVGVEIRFPNAQGGNAGLIVKVDNPGPGADMFTGYEVSLETAGRLVLGRHRQNWEPLRDVPCEVPVGRWIKLEVRMEGPKLEVLIDDRSMLTFEDTEHPLLTGLVGLRTWRRPASYRNLHITTGDFARSLPFKIQPGNALGDQISGMWGPVQGGSARGESAIDTRNPFAGRQGQKLTFFEGEGVIGIENRGLNHWGLNLVEGRPYEGYLWARAEKPTRVTVGLEGGDGRRILAETRFEVLAGDWTRHEFKLTPNGSESSGRFAIKLEEPGSITLGHAFLQPGEWGRYKGLPDRKDVVQGLIDQGVTILRYGGSMVNHPEYRWKRMIGPRDRRPPTAGWWYPYSSNGWGIFDFLNLCEAAGFVGIPAIHMGESPRDMADFVEYANGPADSEWGRKRVEDGHPEPYRLEQVELGNEEAVNEAYWEKFRPMAEAMWAKDPNLILIVGDFAYNKVIDDPDHFEGGVAVNSLAAHRKILELARARGREVWFDIHVSTNQPPEPNGLLAERSYIEQLGKLAPGARYKVTIFEYNSGNHSMKRALSNALATNEVERVGDLLPIACSANCLQPDGQNDNGWDQGLLFLDPSKVWLQPPGYVTRMTRRHFRPMLVHSEIRGHAEKLSVNVKRGEDGNELVLQVVNWADEARPTRIEVEGYIPPSLVATVEQMSGPLDGANPSEDTGRIKPVISKWRHFLDRGPASFTFPPRSITIVHFR
ncbi:family 16 glycoside hydrolase [Tundrisphaera lichenicola]|uniref:family 16 glycoside hydrolase n=1 Tax=Tundrisphaera lichenicola TaxID=2029860 RepID=UPI003EB749C4